MNSKNMNIKDMNIEKSAITIQFDHETSKVNAFLTDLPEMRTTTDTVEEAIEELQLVQRELTRAIDDDYVKNFRYNKSIDYEELKEALDINNTTDLYRYR